MSKDGGSAFPTTKPLEGWGDPNKGMSLRDYFAGQALAGRMAALVSHENITSLARVAADLGRTTDEQIAIRSYEMADAMIEAKDRD